MLKKISRSTAITGLILYTLTMQPIPLAAAQNSQETTDAAQALESRPDPLYVIQPNDILEIFVWKEPELTRKVLVRPDGRISFPLVQDLQAAGISPGELKDKIEEKLKEFLSAPNVTVIVDAIQSYRIFVIGKVQTPGAMSIEKPITVLQSLALAGGFQDYADESGITIIRNTGTLSFIFRFNYKDVVQGRRSEQNIFLRAGDVVVVP